MLKVAILGAGGRMGQALIRCSGPAGVSLAAAIENAGHPLSGTDAGTAAGLPPLGLPVSDAIEAAGAADVLIDFTFHAAAPAHAAYAARHGKALVLGTTGLTEAELGAVRDASGSVPVVWAPNMSLGMNVLFALTRKAAAVLGESYDVEIVETHHRHKRDAPSGTAVRLAENVAEARGRPLAEIACYGRRGISGERPVGEVGIHAVRAGDVVGDHRVLFATEGETVELGHRASSRDSFAMGALHAARWVHGQPAGLYDMQDVLGL